MTEKRITETIKARFCHKSTKAVFVELKDGRHKYIPDSIIHNVIDITNKEEFQEIEVDYWFVRKNEINGDW